MKTELITEIESIKDIDWNEKNLVKSYNSEMIVLTDGEHKPDSFSGIVLVGNQHHKVGDKMTQWSKRMFHLITTAITIKFIP